MSVKETRAMVCRLCGCAIEKLEQGCYKCHACYRKGENVRLRKHRDLQTSAIRLLRAHGLMGKLPRAFTGRDAKAMARFRLKQELTAKGKLVKIEDARRMAEEAAAKARADALAPVPPPSAPVAAVESDALERLRQLREGMA